MSNLLMKDMSLMSLLLYGFRDKGGFNYENNNSREKFNMLNDEDKRKWTEKLRYFDKMEKGEQNDEMSNDKFNELLAEYSAQFKGEN